MENQIIPSKKSPINNSFVSKTFEAFKSQETVQTQFSSQKKIAEQNAIEIATKKFLEQGKQVKIACTGKIDFVNEKTGKVGLQTIQTYKTEQELNDSTFIASSDLSDQASKQTFAAKGLRSMSYGLTKKLSFQKTLPIADIRREVRRNSKATKNTNNTRGFISSNSAITCGEKLAYEKSQKLASMLKAQSLINHVQDESKKAENKLSKLTAKFSAIVAESLQNKKAEQEKLAKFESKIFAIKQSYSKKETVSNIDKIEIFEEIKAGEPCKKVEKVDCIVEESGQLAFDLSA